MIVQIYEVTTRAEARALGAMGVDHIGVLVPGFISSRADNRELDRRVIESVRIRRL